MRRHHTNKQTPQWAVGRAIKVSKTDNRGNCHALGHSFAVHLLEAGDDIRTVQALLEHKNVRTTMICPHVLNKGGKGAISPAGML